MKAHIHVISSLTTHAKLRNAARLFFFLRAKSGKNDVISRENALSIARDSGLFSEYEIMNYLRFLQQEHWLGRRKDGIYVFRGAKFFHQKYSPAGKKSCRVIDIPDHVLSSRSAWSDFVFAGTISGVAASVQAIDVRKRRNKPQVCQSGPDNAMGNIATPVSLSLIGQYVGISKASASRIRKRAGLSGHIQVTPVVTPVVTKEGKSIRITYPDYLRLLALTGNKALLYRRGWLMEQHTSLVIRMDTSRKRIGWAKKDLAAAKAARDLTNKH